MPAPGGSGSAARPRTNISELTRRVARSLVANNAWAAASLSYRECAVLALASASSKRWARWLADPASVSITAAVEHAVRRASAEYYRDLEAFDKADALARAQAGAHQLPQPPPPQPPPPFRPPLGPVDPEADTPEARNVLALRIRVALCAQLLPLVAAEVPVGEGSALGKRGGSSAGASGEVRSRNANVDVDGNAFNQMLEKRRAMQIVARRAYLHGRGEIADTTANGSVTREDSSDILPYFKDVATSRPAVGSAVVDVEGVFVDRLDAAMWKVARELSGNTTRSRMHGEGARIPHIDLVLNIDNAPSSPESMEGVPSLLRGSTAHRPSSWDAAKGFATFPQPDQVSLPAATSPRLSKGVAQLGKSSGAHDYRSDMDGATSSDAEADDAGLPEEDDPSSLAYTYRHHAPYIPLDDCYVSLEDDMSLVKHLHAQVAAAHRAGVLSHDALEELRNNSPTLGLLHLQMLQEAATVTNCVAGTTTSSEAYSGSQIAPFTTSAFTSSAAGASAAVAPHAPTTSSAIAGIIPPASTILSVLAGPAAAAAASGVPGSVAGVPGSQLSKDGNEEDTRMAIVNSSFKFLIEGVSSLNEPRSLKVLRNVLTDVRPRLSSKLVQGMPGAVSEEKVGMVELIEACSKVLNELKADKEHSWPFLQPVKPKEAPQYYDIIKNPMDLRTMTQKLKAQQYMSKADFVADLNLIWDNCLTYNVGPPENIYRKLAHAMRAKTNQLIPNIPNIVVRDKRELETDEEADGAGSTANGPTGGNEHGGAAGDGVSTTVSEHALSDMEIDAIDTILDERIGTGPGSTASSVDPLDDHHMDIPALGKDPTDDVLRPWKHHYAVWRARKLAMLLDSSLSLTSGTYPAQPTVQAPTMGTGATAGSSSSMVSASPGLDGTHTTATTNGTLPRPQYRQHHQHFSSSVPATSAQHYPFHAPPGVLRTLQVCDYVDGERAFWVRSAIRGYGMSRETTGEDNLSDLYDTTPGGGGRGYLKREGTADADGDVDMRDASQEVGRDNKEHVEAQTPANGASDEPEWNGSAALFAAQSTLWAQSVSAHPGAMAAIGKATAATGGAGGVSSGASSPISFAFHPASTHQPNPYQDMFGHAAGEPVVPPISAAELADDHLVHRKWFVPEYSIGLPCLRQGPPVATGSEVGDREPAEGSSIVHQLPRRLPLLQGEALFVERQQAPSLSRYSEMHVQTTKAGQLTRQLRDNVKEITAIKALHNKVTAKMVKCFRYM